MADLTVNGFVGRMSLFVAEDSVVILEHGSARDRVSRIPLENIESVIVWKKRAWVKMTLAFLIIGGFAFLPLYKYWEFGDEALLATGLFLAVTLVLMEIALIARKNYHIRINHGGETFKITFATYPWVIRRFVEKLKTKAQAAQNKLRAKRDQAYLTRQEPGGAPPPERPA